MSRMNSLRDIDLHKIRNRCAALTEEQIYQTIEYYYRRDGRSLTAFEIVHILDAPSKRVEDLMTSLRVKGRIIKVDQTGRYVPVDERMASAVTVTRIEPERGCEDVTRARKLPEDEQLYAEVLARQQKGQPYARHIADKYGVTCDWVMGAMSRIRRERKEQAEATAVIPEEAVEMQTETRETTTPTNGFQALNQAVAEGLALRQKERNVRLLRKLFAVVEDDAVLGRVLDVLREEGVA